MASKFERTGKGAFRLLKGGTHSCSDTVRKTILRSYGYIYITVR